MVTRVFLPTLVGSLLLQFPFFQFIWVSRMGGRLRYLFIFILVWVCFACLEGSDAFYNFVFQSLCLTLLLAGFADMCVSCRFPILWSLFPPSASSSPCGSAEAWTATTIIQHSCFVRPCIRNSSASALPARPSCVFFCPWCLVQFCCKRAKKIENHKVFEAPSRLMLKHLQNDWVTPVCPILGDQVIGNNF